MTRPKMMNRFEKVPVMLSISVGEFSLIIAGMTELNNPAVIPWRNLATNSIL